MDQIFYRTPLKTDMIKFDCSNSKKKKYVPHGTIPVYYPEFDSFTIDFDDEQKETQGTIPLHYPEFDSATIDFGDDQNQTQKTYVLRKQIGRKIK